jgi:hypothetical protein
MDKELKKKLDLLNSKMSQKSLQNDKQIITLHKPNIRKKMADAKLGTTVSADVKKKMSEAKKGKKPNNYGKKHKSKRIIPAEMREKISKTLKGVVHSKESCEKRSKTMSGKPKPTVKCPHCGKEGGKPAMMKHHFDNCKFK